MLAARQTDLAHSRAHWFRKQGLEMPAPGTLADVVATTGWIRTLGGADVYLATRARHPGLSRAAMDVAAAKQELRVLPAVRGCIYLVPAHHAALVMRFAEGIWRPRAEKDIERAGAKWKEVEVAAKAVRSVLSSEGLTTDALRKAVPPSAIRSFGEIGKKVGLSSALPVALRELEFAGEIERTFDGGKLDTERYLWRKPKNSLFEGTNVPADLIGQITRLAEIFFSQMGPATLKQFTEWAGVTQRDAKVAIAGLPLVSVTIDGYASEALVLEAELPALLAGSEPSGTVSFLSFEDNYLTAHGGPGLVSPSEEHGRAVEVWGSTRGTTLGDAKHVSHRAVVVDGLLAGFWEFDPDERAVVTGLFGPQPKAVQKTIDAQAAELGRFIVEEIGHARSFTLDTDDAVRERAAYVRAINTPAKKRVGR